MWRRPENIRIVNRMLTGLKDLAETYDCTLANLCICWNAMLSPMINVLCGARRISQIEDSARSMDIVLFENDFLRMRQDADRAVAEQEAEAQKQ